MSADDWYHRGPCHRCSVCGEDGCWVYNPDPPDPDAEEYPEHHQVHICAAGCDGWTP